MFIWQTMCKPFVPGCEVGGSVRDDVRCKRAVTLQTHMTQLLQLNNWTCNKIIYLLFTCFQRWLSMVSGNSWPPTSQKWMCILLVKVKQKTCSCSWSDPRPAASQGLCVGDCLASLHSWLKKVDLICLSVLSIGWKLASLNRIWEKGWEWGAGLFWSQWLLKLHLVEETFR